MVWRRERRRRRRERKRRKEHIGTRNKINTCSLITFRRLGPNFTNGLTKMRTIKLVVDKLARDVKLSI